MKFLKRFLNKSNDGVLESIVAMILQTTDGLMSADHHIDDNVSPYAV